MHVSRLLRCSEDPTSALAKQIWKASVRSVRMPDLWSNFSRQVVAQSPFLTPRDVATIVHSFARVKYRDDKVLQSITPSILKHLDSFSVREIVHIMSAFRKLEYSRLDCIDLLTNQLVLKASEWNAVDCALIANAAGWFRVFDHHLWTRIERHIIKHVSEFSPLGIGLVLGALAKLDMRNERILRLFARQLVGGTGSGVVKQESFAIIVHSFYKLGWTRDYKLNVFLETQVRELLTQPFFDPQSVCLVLHALFGYRISELTAAGGLTPVQREILNYGVNAVLHPQTEEWKPNIDQWARLDSLTAVLSEWGGDDVKRLSKFLAKSDGRKDQPTRGHKLPRWEYEVYRILKDKMEVNVKKRVRNGRTDIVVHPPGGGKAVVVICLGPFQYYANSTKRTTSSVLNRSIITSDRNTQVLEIPFFIWNELKTDQDKIFYLYSRGRQVARGDDEDVSGHGTQGECETEEDNTLMPESGSVFDSTIDSTDLEYAQM